MAVSGFPRGIYLCLRSLIREMSYDTEILSLLMIVNSSAIIGKTIAFHCPVYIALCRFFCIRQRLIFLFFVKPILDQVIDHHLIPWGHTIFIVVNRFLG